MSSAAIVYCRASGEMSNAEVAIRPNCLCAQHSKVTHLLHKHLAWPLQFILLPMPLQQQEGMSVYAVLVTEFLSTKSIMTTL